MLFLGLTNPVAMAFDGRLANATVSFGQWQTDPPFDRFPNSSPADRNNHALIPDELKIPLDGAINFLIGGFHIVYDVGTQPGDVDATKTTPSTGTPTGVPLIDDPTNRVYRGLDPSLQPRDRGEVVYFPKPGTYVVICGIQGHFVNDGLFEFVTVLATSIIAD